MCMQWLVKQTLEEISMVAGGNISAWNNKVGLLTILSQRYELYKTISIPWALVSVQRFYINMLEFALRYLTNMNFLVFVDIQSMWRVSIDVEECRVMNG